MEYFYTLLGFLLGISTMFFITELRSLLKQRRYFKLMQRDDRMKFYHEQLVTATHNMASAIENAKKGIA